MNRMTSRGVVVQYGHALTQIQDATRLLRYVVDAKEYRLSKELLRFLRSVDENGAALRTAIRDVGILADVADQVAE